VKEGEGWDAKHGKSKAEIRGDMGKNREGVGGGGGSSSSDA